MSTTHEIGHIPPLARGGHAAHSNRCMSGLPNSQTEVDSSRLAVAFYCLGSLDLLGMLKEKTSDTDREVWREWIWEQQTRGRCGTGFKPSSYMTAQGTSNVMEESFEYNAPHLIMTYTALLSLSILRDNFSRLDRSGILTFLRSCQREDGSFSTIPQSSDSDLRTVYCAFAISSMLGDWSGVDVVRAVGFIRACRTYEGGYGQSPFCEAQGGTTYTALAALYIAPPTPTSAAVTDLPPPMPLTPSERMQTVRWLIQNQDISGGFRGRTGKEADACYCFWCGASLQILGASDLVDTASLAAFVGQCQFKFGGIAKAPGEHPDPYHTYLSLAALSICPPEAELIGVNPASWKFAPLDPLLNAREETACWARKYIPVASGESVV